MIKNKLSRKAAMPPDIVILVIMAVILSGACLYVFYNHSGKVSLKISDSRFLNSVYSNESKIIFYTENAIEKSISKIINKENPIPEFLINLKSEILKYKVNNSYIIIGMDQIENEISSENVLFSDGKIYFNISVNLNSDLDKFKINYNFNKIFIKPL